MDSQGNGISGQNAPGGCRGPFGQVDQGRAGENMEGVGFFGDVESWVMTEIDFNEVAAALLEDVE